MRWQLSGPWPVGSQCFPAGSIISDGEGWPMPPPLNARALDEDAAMADGPSHRYFFHPVTLYLMKDQALQEAFDADPGAKEAIRRDTTKLAKALGRMSSDTDDAEGPKG